MTAREDHLVELVDSAGTAIGSATVSAAHQTPGQLHRAFSVFVQDADGRVLLQQRAAMKTRFPLRWANTACGHPAPGESLVSAAARRLAEEVGLDGVELGEVGVHAYYAEDPSTGRVEYEYDHVLVGTLPVGAVAVPDPAEVASLRWVTVEDLAADLGAHSRAYAPWLAGVTRCLIASSPAGRSESRPAHRVAETRSPRVAETPSPRTGESLVGRAGSSGRAETPSSGVAETPPSGYAEAPSSGFAETPSSGYAEKPSSGFAESPEPSGGR